MERPPEERPPPLNPPEERPPPPNPPGREEGREEEGRTVEEGRKVLLPGRTVEVGL